MTQEKQIQEPNIETNNIENNFGKNKVTFNIPRTLRETNKRAAETYSYVQNKWYSFTKKHHKNKEMCYVALKIKREFNNYLDAIAKNNDSENFPYLEKEIKNGKEKVKLDPRLSIFFALITELDTQQKLDKISKTYKHNFNIESWPLASDNIYFSAWQTFTKKASFLFSKIRTDVSFDTWAPLSAEERESFEEEYKANLQETPKLEEIPITPKMLKKLGEYSFDTWQVPENITPLFQAIKKMHAYGSTLEQKAPAKSFVAMQLAIDLYDMMADYYQKENPTARDKAHFVSNFKKALHSEDEFMATHRAAWKGIVMNILIACSIIGLVAMAIHGPFFQKANSEKLRSDVNEQFKEIAYGLF